MNVKVWILKRGHKDCKKSVVAGVVLRTDFTLLSPERLHLRGMSFENASVKKKENASVPGAKKNFFLGHTDIV